MSIDRPPNPEEEPLAIVHRPRETIEKQDGDYLDISITPSERAPLVESFLTPWGIGAVFIFLIANSIFTWGQLWNGSQKPAIATATVGETKEKTIDINSLSTLTPSRSPAPKTEKVTTEPAGPVTKPAVTGSLTNALVPPSLQPRLMPTHNVPVTKISQSLPAVEPPAPALPTAEVKKTPEAGTTVAENPIGRAQLQEETRQREALQQKPFFIREKERRLSQQPAAVQNNIPALPQDQILPSGDRGAAPPTPVQPEVQQAPTGTNPPGSIIIDRSGSAGNQ